MLPIVRVFFSVDRAMASLLFAAPPMSDVIPVLVNEMKAASGGRRIRV